MGKLCLTGPMWNIERFWKVQVLSERLFHQSRTKTEKAFILVDVKHAVWGFATTSRQWYDVYCYLCSDKILCLGIEWHPTEWNGSSWEENKYSAIGMTTPQSRILALCWNVCPRTGMTAPECNYGLWDQIYSGTETTASRKLIPFLRAVIPHLALLFKTQNILAGLSECHLILRDHHSSLGDVHSRLRQVSCNLFCKFITNFVCCDMFQWSLCKSVGIPSPCSVQWTFLASGLSHCSQ